MFDIIGKGFKAIYVFFAGHPEGYGEMYNVSVDLSYGNGSRKKIEKVLRKALIKIFDPDNKSLDEAIERLFEWGELSWQFFRELNTNNLTGDYRIDRCVDGVKAHQFKKLIDKTNVGLTVEIEDETDYYKRNYPLYRLKTILSNDYAEAMNSKNFEKAGEIKKNLMDLGHVLSGREDAVPYSIGYLIREHELLPKEMSLTYEGEL